MGGRFLSLMRARAKTASSEQNFACLASKSVRSGTLTNLPTHGAVGQKRLGEPAHLLHHRIAAAQGVQ